jgi:hypothetical protein
MEHGIKNESDVKIGFQTGFLYIGGNAYTCKALASRRKLNLQDVHSFFGDDGRMIFTDEKAKEAIELFNTIRQTSKVRAHI